MNILAIIPARGGSKGIPRKNVRPLNDMPLIYYAIHNALCSIYNLDVYVSSDDEEILSISKKLSAKIHVRKKFFSEDNVTLDPVIHNALSDIELKEKKIYSYVITLQPTSPLIKVSTIDKAIEYILSHPEIDTLISAKEDFHLSWKKNQGQFVPNFKKRLNRQYLQPVYRETGGFLITKRHLITETNRIGQNVDLFLLSNGEELDIDSYEDWNICEFYLKRKKVLFVVSGNLDVGLGHVYNTLLVANDILDHDVQFIVDYKSQLAFDKISSLNYKVIMQQADDIVKDIIQLKPDIVINDRLDNSYAYIDALKKERIKVINFEDRGEGSQIADLVINAIYSEKKIIQNSYFGHQYFVLRDEFLLASPVEKVNKNVSNVLLCFGGTDPNNYTLKVLNSIYDYCLSNSITINIVTGIGYHKYDSLKPYNKAKIFIDINRISDYMLQSDIIFSACGRTTYEIASLAIPAIIMAQNERELTHYFPYGQNGFINLGIGKIVSQSEILKEFKKLVINQNLRQKMSNLMKKTDCRQGRSNVNRMIKQIIENVSNEY